MLSVIFNPKNTTLPGDSSAEPQNDICHVERKRNIPWKGKTYGLDVIRNIQSEKYHPSGSTPAHTIAGKMSRNDKSNIVILYLFLLS